MRAIRITRVPGGDAPEEIRRAWVGLVIPVDETIEQPTLIESRMISSGVYAGPVKGCTVMAIEAFKELARSGSDAYHWWWKHARQYYQPGMHLVFNSEACELIDA